MTRVRLIHWDVEEGPSCLKVLATESYQVEWDARPGPDLFKRLTADPPAALVIDLSRLPSAGRDLALEVRLRRSTRHVPLVFVGGDPAKVDRDVPNAAGTGRTASGWVSGPNDRSAARIV